MYFLVIWWSRDKKEPQLSRINHDDRNQLLRHDIASFLENEFMKILKSNFNLEIYAEDVTLEAG